MNRGFAADEIPDGLMFTGTAVRAVAARVAASNAAKQQKQVADAELRRLAETTAAGRGAAAGKGVAGGRGGRWPRALILEGCRCRVRRTEQR